MVVQPDNKLLNLQRGVYACCALSLIATVVVMTIKLVSLSSISYFYYYKSYDTDRGLVIAIGVLSIMVQILGAYGAYRQSNRMSVTYGVICSILSGLTVVYAILYYLLAILLVAALFVSGSTGSLYAKHIRRLKKQALNTTIYDQGMPGPPQTMAYPMPNYGVPPGTGGHINYAVSGPGQPAYGHHQQPSYIIPGPQVAPNSQPYMTSAFPNPNPYQPSPQDYVVATPTPTVSYAEPTVQPPSYNQSQQPFATTSAPNELHFQEFGASNPSAQRPPVPPVPATIAPYKSMPETPAWQS